MIRPTPLRFASILGSFTFALAACGGTSSTDGSGESSSTSGSSSGAASSSSSTSSSSSAGSSSSSGGGGGGQGGSGPFAPASHEAAPLVVDSGGFVMKKPKVLVISYDSDPHGAKVDDLMTKLQGSAYWTAIVSEYGVGPLEAKPPIHLAGNPPSSTFSESVLLAELDTNTTSANAAWGAADPSTIYLFVVPQGYAVNDGSTCCQDYDGYHAEHKVTSGATVPYAVVCACPGFDGPTHNVLQSLTTAVTHELAEAATDPYPNANTAYGDTDNNHAVWTVLTGGEVGDLCSYNTDAYIVPAELGYTVQKIWSNKAAKAGNNPCVPVLDNQPYFNSVPVLDDAATVTTYGQPWKTKGVKIPVGQSKTIEVDLFSDAPVSQAWTVHAWDAGDYLGGTKHLSFTWDKTTGQNGDKLQLTIHVDSADNADGGEPFIIESTSGNSDNLWMGFVAN